MFHSMRCKCGCGRTFSKRNWPLGVELFPFLAGLFVSLAVAYALPFERGQLRNTLFMLLPYVIIAWIWQKRPGELDD